jgi:hypothetical protein
MTWIYTADKGIQNLETGIQINFGTDRNELRRLLAYNEQKNHGRFESEDSYEDVFYSKDWIRISFDGNQRLHEIEIIIGTVDIHGVDTTVNQNLSTTLEKLRSRGLRLEKDDYGYLCFDYKFHIGDSGDSGGVDDQIGWVYLTRDAVD